MIHCFNHKDVYCVMDVASGAIHVVDPLVYDLLIEEVPLTGKLPEDWSYSKEETEEALEEIALLRERGQLYSEDKMESLRKEFPLAPVIKAMCLHVSHDCNLRCKYCFASQGDFKGHREVMTLETGKKALDFLVEHSGQRRNLEVDFFGGEPLMNMEVVKGLVAYGREIEKTKNKKFRFTLTTNGMLLDEETSDYLNEVMDNVVLSIDGRPSTNDALRKTISGDGSYDIILPKLKYFSQIRGEKPHYIRGTYTGLSLDFSEDLIHLAQEGFTSLSMEPVVCDPSEVYALKEEDLPTIYAEYDKLAEYMLETYGTEKKFDFFHFALDLSGGPCAIKKSMGCGAGSEYIAVTPFGELYPCHQFVGNEAFKLGDLDNGFTQKSKREEFFHLSVLDKEICQDCWAKYHCSGGCHANAWHHQGDMKIPYELGCHMMRKRLELAIYLAVKKREKSENQERTPHSP